MKRLIKANSDVALDNLCNWVENSNPISESDYNYFLNDYSVKGTFYRVLGFEYSDVEDVLSSFPDQQIISRDDVFNALKSLIQDDGRICSWTKTKNGLDQILMDASDIYDVSIVITAEVEGIDINKISKDNEDKMGYILYDYQEEILGKQTGDSKIIDVYYGGLHERMDLKEGTPEDYINLFE